MKTESKNAKKLHSNRKFHYQRTKDFNKSYIDEKTGHWYKKYTKNRPCPVCESNKKKDLFNKSGGIYVKCEECEMIYLDPVFKEKHLNDYYKNLDSGQGDKISKESLFYKENYTNGLFDLEKYIDKGKILDMGCSIGIFLDIAKERGWETFGLELHIEDAKIAEKKGHTIFKETLEKQQVTNKFDVISLWNVFEHLPDPHSYLNLLSTFLRKKGLIFLEIPNVSGLAPRIMQSKCNMFDGLAHCNLYSIDTLELVAKKNGFSLVDAKTIISEISVLNNYLYYDDPYFGKSNYGLKLLDFIDEKKLHDNLLGYKLDVILQKD